MAISVADKMSANTGGGSSSATGIWPNGAPANGDLLILAAEGQFNTTLTFPTGWTQLFQGNDSSNGFATGFAYKWAGNSEPTSITCSVSSGTNCSFTALRYTGNVSQVAWTQNTNWSAKNYLSGAAVTFTTTSLTASATAGQTPVLFQTTTGTTSINSPSPGTWTTNSSQASGYSTYGYTRNTTTSSSETINPSSTSTGTTSNFAGNSYLALLTPISAPGVSPTSLTFTTTPTQTFTVSGGLAPYTVMSADTSIATASISGSTVTVTPQANGGPINVTVTDSSPTTPQTASCAVTVNIASNPVNVSPTTQELWPYDAANQGQVSATLTATQSGNSSFTWSTSNAAVATVSGTTGTGTVTYVGPGNATITALGASGRTATCIVTCVGSLIVGGITTANSSGIFTAQQTNSTDTITVTVAPSGIISVAPLMGTAPGPISFTVSGISAGVATVTVTDQHNSTVSFEITNTVTGPIIFTPTAIGYPTAGAWFDFGQQDAEGYPCVGEIRNMHVNGFVSLRAPGETGTFVWGAGDVDLCGEFAMGYGDISSSGPSQPISVTFAGKNDMFTDAFGDDSPLMIKDVTRAYILTSTPQIVVGVPLIFTAIFGFDQLVTTQSSGTTSPSTAQINGATVGSAIVGYSVVSSATAVSYRYDTTAAEAQNPPQGRVVQIGWSENSIYPWSCLGYLAYVTPHKVLESAY